MAKFRKKVKEFEAFQWTGGLDQKEDPLWAIKALKVGLLRIVHPGTQDMYMENSYTSMIEPGGWVVNTGTYIELYSDEEFKEKFEEVKVNEPTNKLSAD